MPGRSLPSRPSWMRLGGSLQLYNREMLPTREVADLELEPSTSSATNRRLRTGAGRAAWPSASRFEAGHEAGRLFTKVDFVGGPYVQPSMWPMTVVPRQEQKKLAPKRIATVRDDQPSRALVFDRRMSRSITARLPYLPTAPKRWRMLLRRHHRLKESEANCFPWSVIKYFGAARAFRITRPRNMAIAFEVGGCSKTANPITRREK